MASSFLVTIYGPERVSKGARKTLRSSINSLGERQSWGRTRTKKAEKSADEVLLRRSAYHQKLPSARNWAATYAKVCTVVSGSRPGLVIPSKAADFCQPFGSTCREWKRQSDQ